MRIVCRQMTLMKYHTLFFFKLGKMSQNLSSAAVLIGALTFKAPPTICSRRQFKILLLFSKITNKACYFTRIVCVLGNFLCFHCLLPTFFKRNFFKIIFQEHYKNVKRFGPDQDRCSVCPDLGPTVCKGSSLSADDKNCH